MNQFDPCCDVTTACESSCHDGEHDDNTADMKNKKSHHRSLRYLIDERNGEGYDSRDRVAGGQKACGMDG